MLFLTTSCLWWVKASLSKTIGTEWHSRSNSSLFHFDYGTDWHSRSDSSLFFYYGTGYTPWVTIPLLLIWLRYWVHSVSDSSLFLWTLAPVMSQAFLMAFCVCYKRRLLCLLFVLDSILRSWWAKTPLSIVCTWLQYSSLSPDVTSESENICASVLLFQ